MTATVGWFGKLPGHGDFLQRRVAQSFFHAWDPWLQAGVAHSKALLAGEWLSIYLTSPIWRFFLSEGTAGDAAYAGILAPSVDRVGRYFPLTIVAELPAGLPPMAVAIYGREWFSGVESVALQALEEDAMDVGEFDEAVQGTAELLRHVERHARTVVDDDFPGAADYWRLPVLSGDRVAASLIDPLTDIIARRLRPMSMWWSDGSERITPTCLLARALPDAGRFTALLTGEWQATGWCGEFGQLDDCAPPQFEYDIVCGAVTDPGFSRESNQDRFLSSPTTGIWAVADGMGGHSRGEFASQLVIDVLASLEPCATLGAALQSVRAGLARANTDLVRGWQRSGEVCGSTVAVLIVRQQEWGVLWAGDSRVYLLRDGILQALSRDHSVTADVVTGASTAEITRAVGGHDTLRLDTEIGDLKLNDRFLLCSDGLHGVVMNESAHQILTSVSSPGAAADALVSRAIELQTTDNVTATVVDVVSLTNRM